MVDQPLVSICLPIYNGTNYMEHALKSVLSQTFKNFEFIITDDCSTDDTAQVAQRFAEEDNRLKYIKNEHKLGLFGNYNSAMSHARGKYIKLLGHDDVLKPTIVERMVEILERKSRISLVSCAKAWIDSTGGEILPTNRIEQMTMKPFKFDTTLSGREVILKTLQKNVNWIGEPCSLLFRREHLDEGFDTRFRQIGDLDLSYRILEKGDYHFISDTLCFFRRHDEAISKTNLRSLSALLDWFLLGNKYKSYILEADGDENIYVERLTKRLSLALSHEIFQENQKSAELKDQITKAFFKGKNPLDAFKSEKNSDRIDLEEYHAIGILALIEAANLCNELQLAENRKKDVEAEIVRLPAEIEEQRKILTDEVNELKGSLSEMGTSLSWKITTPLRNLNKLISKIRS